MTRIFTSLILPIFATTLLCSTAYSQCGDCNEDGVASTVLDALAAALISVGLNMPSDFQTVYCDVDSSLDIDIIDALLIARFAVGLPVTYDCPGDPSELGLIETFGTLGGTAGMTNGGIQTQIYGDIGTTAASTSVTGFHDSGPGCTYTETPLNVGVVHGLIYTDAPPPTVGCPNEGTAATAVIALQASQDALRVYNALAAMPSGSDPGAGSLANLVLTPGVYTSASGSFLIQGGDLTLDAQGDPNARFVFQMASTLTVGSPGFPQSVILINDAVPNNVFWQVGSAATINAAGGGTMVGTIIAREGVDVSTQGNVILVTINGRALSLGASVTLVDTIINVPAP